ncbi:aminopeptidase N precursor [Danaus plexippus plexippus]|uniref:Aminopeptidase n=1 Tax=Danaus plexippus plexippus TaxID=278856 RepID=A0A212EJU6_DANPL|nr:aminopeptidase N precursor [Danaus plexippus plexippus]
MENRWLSLVFGLIFIQGLLALSPIPVADDEWEEFSRTLRSPAYRLPNTTKPSKYEISLIPYFDVVPTPNIPPFSFDGQVSIWIQATQAGVREIVMHCNSLVINSVTVSLNNTAMNLTNSNFTCEMPYAFLRIGTNEPLQMGQEYLIHITYRGFFQTNMRGFYRSWYRDSTGFKWMGTTQFQPGHARQAFPCYDEPSFKAYFDITIHRERSFSPTISNMPIKSISTTAVPGRISETFFTTPLTSTYLLAFIVSHYDRVESNGSPNRPFDIYARNNAGITGNYSLVMGEKLLEAMENYTQIPYYTMARNITMQQAAIPDFSAGAMENWGLLTYREALILFDPQNTNNFYKQRIANIVSHEIAHMWFGNLVTCAWWDNLWLNEGFARFYQYYLTHSVAEDLGFDIRFIVEQLQTAMISDSIDSAHALINPDVNDPTSVSNHFSTITYARGASILRMTQHFLGESTYLKGLRKYLRARQFDVAEPQHLFNALDEAAREDGALSAYGGITINSYFRSWAEKAGHPLLTVTINQTSGLMTVTQARWERNTGVSNFTSIWEVPITWTRAGAPDFNNLKPSQVITADVTNIERGTRGLEWVIFNKQESGFYRVNYDDVNWALLTRALRSSNRTVIHELNRAQIVDDLFQLARAGVMTYNRAFNILSFLEFEDSYAPWIAAIAGFNFARNRLVYDTTNMQRLQNLAIKLSAAITRRLGHVERNGESFMDGLLRMHVNTFLCNVGHPDCLEAARVSFANWRNGGFIPANMRQWVYCSGLRQGNSSDFDFFWNEFLKEDLANNAVIMIGAAGCTNDVGSLEKFLDAIITVNNSAEIIRPQDNSAAWSSAVTGNNANPMRMLNWLRRNVNLFIERNISLQTPISNIASRLRNENEISELLSWLETNREILGSSYNTGITGIASTRSNMAWSNRRVSEFARYFDTGYIEDKIDDDNGHDSANIATLSIATLLATVAISLNF